MSRLACRFGQSRFADGGLRSRQGFSMRRAAAALGNPSGRASASARRRVGERSRRLSPGIPQSMLQVSPRGLLGPGGESRWIRHVYALPSPPGRRTRARAGGGRRNARAPRRGRRRARAGGGATGPRGEHKGKSVATGRRSRLGPRRRRELAGRWAFRPGLRPRGKPPAPARVAPLSRRLEPCGSSRNHCCRSFPKAGRQQRPTSRNSRLPDLRRLEHWRRSLAAAPSTNNRMAATLAAE